MVKKSNFPENVWFILHELHYLKSVFRDKMPYQRLCLNEDWNFQKKIQNVTMNASHAWISNCRQHSGSPLAGNRFLAQADEDLVVLYHSPFYCQTYGILSTDTSHMFQPGSVTRFADETFPLVVSQFSCCRELWIFKLVVNLFLI